MKAFGMSTLLKNISCWLTSVVLLTVCSSCIYMKMDPPPDVDKVPLPPAANDFSCWLATASNMLAGAGYGTGATVQARADEIYGEMVAQYTANISGWTDTALTWWLSSANNTWPGNPYTVVTVLGNKVPRNPWANPNGARYIGNELRRCQFLGISISWPVAGPQIGEGGHAITGWGDRSGSSATISSNPDEVRVTDSDNDNGGNVQEYDYDSYAAPPVPNEGNGWYFDYPPTPLNPNHPYIKHIVTLCPTDDPSDNKLTQKVVGSYKIHQDKDTSATDLHYEVGTDVTILSYKTTVSWPTDNPPVITESQPRRKLTVDWDFSDKPVPYCTWVTITTEFVLPYWNAIKYSNVHFTYPGDGKAPLPIPGLNWEMRTPEIEEPESITNVTGGYVTGGFDVINPNLPRERRLVAEYRFIHQYSYNQSPEIHTLLLTAPLFSVDVEIESDLNNNVIPEGLRQEFRNNGISLSDGAAVSGEKANVRWLITDETKTYVIKKQKDEIFIYLPREQGYSVTNLRFGHSYGYLDVDQLWEAKEWMTVIAEQDYPLGEEPIEIPIDWKGRLPYPEGDR